MKKITLLLMAVIMTMTMSAQQVQGKKLAPLPRPTEKEVLSPKQHTFIVPKIHNATKAAVKAAGEVVTPPSDLQVMSYRLLGYIYNGSGWEQVSRPLKLGIDGNDVYLQGFCVYLPEAWIKGTISSDGATVTFPMQYYGNYSGYDLYFYPVDGGSAQVIDAVFNYNAEAGTLVLSQDQVCYILENVGNEGLQIVYQYDSSLSIVPDGDTVEAPEGLETQEYALTGCYMGLTGDNEWYEGDPLVGTAKVGFDGDDIYVQGLCTYLPLAWVKGHRDGNNYVFDNGQYFGIFIYEGEAYPLYFMGCQARTLEATPLVMTLDESTGELVAQQWYSISASGEEVEWYDLLGNAKLTPIADEPATPADPQVLYYEYSADDGFGYVMLDVPTTDADGNPLLTSKLGYQLFCDYGGDAEPYIFSAELYGFDEDMTTIPYTFGDDINFLANGQLVVVYNVNDGLRRIGVRSVYAGGGEENFSQIGWYDVEGNAPVTPPEDLETETYSMTAQDLQFGEDSPEDYTAEVKVGFYGSDVYIQGISKWIPEAWIKGTVTRDNMVEFPQHFLGNFNAWGIDMEIVFNGATFAYNPETDTFTSPEGFTSTSTYELEGETYSEDADVFRDVVITRANDVPATPAAPQILNFSLNGSYGYLLELNIPLEDVDGNPIFASQLSYEIYKKVGGVESPVTLEAQYYEYATEDMTIIPYLYTDYWEVMQGGESVYVHAPGIEDWDAIGVKSIYTGGGETHESPITWYDLTTGINTITASDEQPTEYYDLMGRRVDASKLTRGIYITNTGRKVMVK